MKTRRGIQEGREEQNKPTRCDYAKTAMIAIAKSRIWFSCCKISTVISLGMIIIY